MKIAVKTTKLSKETGYFVINCNCNKPCSMHDYYQVRLGWISMDVNTSTRSDDYEYIKFDHSTTSRLLWDENR